MSELTFQATNFSLVASAYAPRVAAAADASCIEYVNDGVYISLQEEAAGKVLKWIGVAVAIIVPFAAPAVFGSIAASGALGSYIGAAASASGWVGTLTNIIGSAVVGGVMQAGAAYLGGARGGDVWRAAGLGAISGGVGGWLRGPTTIGETVRGLTGGAPAATPAATSGVAPGGDGGAAFAGLEGPVGTGLEPGMSAAPGAAAAGAAPSTTMAGAIRQVFGNVSGEALHRISATLINAAITGQDMGRLDTLVEAQKRELAALATSDRAMYNLRISEAQKVLANADRMDPQWYATLAMADVAGIEATEFKQTMRNIATRQGGSLDSGQRKAYERAASLHTGRSKALAYNQKFGEAQMTQNQLRTQVAGLLGPNEAEAQYLQRKHEIEAGQERARREGWASVAGAAIGASEPSHPRSTSPDPTVPEDDPYRSFGSGS